MSLSTVGGTLSVASGTLVGLGVAGVLSVEISPDGWYADLSFEGQSTGGTYDLGLGANGDPDTGTPKLVLTVTSMGFDDTGAPTTVERTVYGTKFVRKPYPNQAQAQETVFGTADVTVRVALSDYVYAKDKAGAGNSGIDVVVSVLAGLYTVGGDRREHDDRRHDRRGYAGPRVCRHPVFDGADAGRGDHRELHRLPVDR
jgi:hypothetical protein